MKNNQLKQDQLNYLEVIAMSVAIIAPTFAMSMNVSLLASVASYSVSLVFLISIIFIGFVAVSFVKFNQYFSTAGSVYTFTKKSLGKTTASVSGWGLFLAYLTFSAGCSAAFGSLFRIFVTNLTGIDLGWIPFTILCVGGIWLISYTDIKLSTRIMFIFEAISIFLILVLSVIILFKVGSNNGLNLTPFKGNGNTISAFGHAGVYALLCFGGFEGASSLGEESKNPKKVIPIAIASTVIIAGLFFVFVSYAQVIGFGTTNDGITALTKSSSTIVDLSKKYISNSFAILITFGASLSAFSSALGTMSAGSRLLYSVSRDGNVPFILSKIHQKHKTPYIALNVMLVAILGIILSLYKHDGIEVFGYVATVGALALLLAYLITSLGSIVYFKKKKMWSNKQLIIPVLALLALAFSFYCNIYPVPDYPCNIFPYIVLGWLVIGSIVTFAYREKRSNNNLEIDDIEKIL